MVDAEGPSARAVRAHAGDGRGEAHATPPSTASTRATSSPAPPHRAASSTRRSTASTPPAGASQLAIAGLNGQTIKRGDILGVPGHLLRAQEDGTVSGGIVTIGIRGKLRTPLLHGDTVTWNAPTTTFQAQGRPEILYLAGYSPEFTLELVERWV